MKSIIFKALQIVSVFLLTLMLLISLFSCTPQKRLNRLVKKYPYLITKDSQIIKDSFLIPEIKKDTFFKSKIGKKDTFNLKAGDIEIQIIKNPGKIDEKDSTKNIDDSFDVKIKQPKKTIYKTIKAPVNKLTTAPADNKLKYLYYSLVCLLLIIILSEVFYRTRRNPKQ